MADEESTGVSESQLLAEVEKRVEGANHLMARKDKIGALKFALQNPPVNSKNPETKEKNAAILETILASLNDSEIKAAVEALDLDSCDVLMKYVYRFMGKAASCGTMLKLHALLSEKAGVGSIIRVLTDRKQV